MISYPLSLQQKKYLKKVSLFDLKGVTKVVKFQFDRFHMKIFYFLPILWDRVCSIFLAVLKNSFLHTGSGYPRDYVDRQSSSHPCYLTQDRIKSRVFNALVV